MTDLPTRPEARDGVVADAVQGNWVDTRAPAWSRGYLRLSRADRPIGTWLLFLPCAWGVLLSAVAQENGLGWSGLWILVGCGIGAWLMRGAGCTWNDLTDRDIDAAVRRTASRPLPSGQVTPRGAVIWMCVQSLLAFGILLTFNLPAIALGVASLALVCVYPFAKRFTWWPQVFLGLAFNWGALLAWTAHHGSLAWPAVAAYGAGIAWTLFYDTIYAHQDREDDALIGVKSTARLFGDRTGVWLWRFEVVTGTFLALAVWLAVGPDQPGALVAGLAGAAAMTVHLDWQRRQMDIHDADRCLALFRQNRLAGLIFAGGLAFGLLL